VYVKTEIGLELVQNPDQEDADLDYVDNALGNSAEVSFLKSLLFVSHGVQFLDSVLNEQNTKKQVPPISNENKSEDVDEVSETAVPNNSLKLSGGRQSGEWSEEVEAAGSLIDNDGSGLRRSNDGRRALERSAATPPLSASSEGLPRASADTPPARPSAADSMDFDGITSNCSPHCI